MTTTDEEILAYARHLKQTDASISDEDLRRALTLRFLGGNDTTVPLPKAGIVPSPFGDFKARLSIIFNSIRKGLTFNRRKRAEIEARIISAILYINAMK